jgi:ABC-type phosphate transport system substrate-binding protein
MALTLASLFVFLSGVRGDCAEKRPVSRQELNENLERAKLEMHDAERRLQELAERSRQIEEELKSPDRKRTIAEIRKEHDAIAKEWAEQTRRDNEATKLYDDSLINAVKSCSVLIAGTANACGVIERLYPDFLGTLEPKQASSFPSQIRYEPEGSDLGLKKLIAGQTEAVALDRPLSKEEKAALKKAFSDPQRQPQEVVFCRAAVAIIVHRSNRFQGLTMDQVQQIYRAKIEKWSAIGGADQSIGRLGTKYPLLSWWMFTNRILHGETVRFPDEFKFDPNHLPQAEELHRFYKEQHSRFPGGGPFPCFENDAKLVEEVSKKSNAIGYCLLFASSERMKNVRLVPIARKQGDDPVVPLHNGALSDTYPLQEVMWFLVHPDVPESTKAFVEYCTSSKAASTIKQCGLWPDCQLEQVRGQQRLAEVKNGKGTEIVVCDLTGWEELLKDLSFEFVKAKAAVQLKFQKGETQDTASEKLAKGATDLLLADKDSGQWSAASGQSVANQKSVEKGTVPGTLQGEGQSPIPRSIELGRMAVGVIVHPENPLESLPMDEAKSIFCGEIKKWPAVRGAAAAMHVFGLKHTDPMTQLLKEKLVERGRSLKYSTQPDNEKVILAVARDPAAIGFVDMSQLPPNDKSVKLVPVFEGAGRRQGDSPIFVERKLGQSPIPNPLSRTLTLYVSPNASQTAKDFAEFLTPEHCKETIAQHNILPPLHAEGGSQLAGRARRSPHPGPLPKGEGMIDLTSADEPIPPLLDDPDAPQDQGRAKIKKLAAKPKPVIPAPEQPAPPKVTADAQPAPETESEPAPTQTHPGAPSLTDEQIVWLVGGIAGVVLLALGVGWLQAPHRKRKRR